MQLRRQIHERVSPLPTADTVLSERRMRWGGWLIAVAWLAEFAYPVIGLLEKHHSPVSLAFGFAALGGSIALYLWLMLSCRSIVPTRQWPVWWLSLSGFTAAALVSNLVYGAAWIGLYVFIAVAAARATPRIAMRLIIAITIASFFLSRYEGLTVRDSGQFAVQVALIGFSMIGVMSMGRLNRELRAAREELARRAVAEERLRFARELHDSVTQELFSMTLHARTTVKQMERAETPADDPVYQQVRILSDLAQSALAEMRMLIFELRPSALTEEGLVGAVRKLAASISAREALAIELDAPDDRLLLAGATEEHLYRLIQEALNNVVKHAGARRAVVHIGVANGSERLVVEIHDDGTGFDPAGTHPGHMGLQTMAARTDELGGTYTIESAIGTGTTIRVTVPLTTARHETQRSSLRERSAVSR